MKKEINWWLSFTPGIDSAALDCKFKHIDAETGNSCEGSILDFYGDLPESIRLSIRVLAKELARYCESESGKHESIAQKVIQEKNYKGLVNNE